MSNWEAEEFGENDGYDCMTGGIFIVDEGGKTVVCVDAKDFGQKSCADISGEVLQKTEAVARLIAAAPVLYEAVEAILAANCRDDEEKAVRLCEYALKKAKGE